VRLRRERSCASAWELLLPVRPILLGTLRVVHQLIASPLLPSSSSSSFSSSSLSSSSPPSLAYPFFLETELVSVRWSKPKPIEMDHGQRSPEGMTIVYAGVSNQRRTLFRKRVPCAEALPRIHGLVDRMVRCLPCSRWRQRADLARLMQAQPARAGGGCRIHRFRARADDLRRCKE
jgi:hypothetical protein